MSPDAADARPVHDGLYQTDPPRLLGTRCDDCGQHTFPRAASCPYCGSERVREVALSDSGTLWGWTTVTAPPPGYRGEVPFGFGIVALPEGVRVITRLAAPVDGYSHGLPMRLRIVPLHVADDGTRIETWEFTP
ncbi:MAG: Zn-ribbon domain-containing OB-fold protein [Acidimicrobiia bacterium]